MGVKRAKERERERERASGLEFVWSEELEEVPRSRIWEE